MLDQHIAEVYADYLMVPLFDIRRRRTRTRSLPACCPRSFAASTVLCRWRFTTTCLDVAFATFEDMLMVDELQLLTGLTIRPMMAPLSVVEKTLDTLYLAPRTKFISHLDDYANDGGGRARKTADEHDESVLEIDAPPPPGPDGRIDPHGEPDSRAGAAGGRQRHSSRTVRGFLRHSPARSTARCASYCRRRQDRSSCRLSPDSRFWRRWTSPRSAFRKTAPSPLRSGDKRIDLRVSTVPTVYGEKMVMRILDKGAIPIELTGLGFDERQSKDLIESIQMPHGLMLVTGPTGSGKSTTLYACLNKLNEPDTNICTVEDPVEYKFKGINQVQVKTQVGLTFAGALRAFLRQDPDVIMVGEVRDQETAQICLRAALTGHFVLSTIHTNDSLSAVNRLVDMGIEPFLLALTLRVLEAQRLIRRLCKECKEPFECDRRDGEAARSRSRERCIVPKVAITCRGAGYRGRIGVFEVVRITAAMANLIQTRARPCPSCARPPAKKA